MRIKTRTEIDGFGPVQVPADRYWGAQTQRSLEHFSIGTNRLPIELIHAQALLKKAAATANFTLGVLDADRCSLIQQAADEVIIGQLDNHFPLYVWMTGSGTQSNMNVNEVISNRAIEIYGGQMGSKVPIHPNDHVNMSQSTNDAFPSAMCIATATLIKNSLIPAVTMMRDELDAKSQEWNDIVKIGRTHMQDAVPMTLGQEFSGYAVMLTDNISRLEWALKDIYKLAIGGTAVGTGLNAEHGFAELAAREISNLTGLPFVSAPNKFAVQGAHDALVMASAVFKTLAGSLLKISNDIKFLSCGPRAGISELSLPANEPGSSIMPGKVNPTQCEAMAMVCVQVMGYDTAVAIAGCGGELEMNVYKPLIIYNIIESAKILSGSCTNFTKYLLKGTVPNRENIDRYLQESLMLVTALTPVIGYDKAAEMAHYADKHNCTLKEANHVLGFVDEEEFDTIVDPSTMARP